MSTRVSTLAFPATWSFAKAGEAGRLDVNIEREYDVIIKVTIKIVAGVFISVFTPSESAHQISKAFVTSARERSIPIIVPVLVLPEIFAAIARGQGKPELGIAFAKELKSFPGITLFDLDESLANFGYESSGAISFIAVMMWSMRQSLCAWAKGGLHWIKDNWRNCQRFHLCIHHKIKVQIRNSSIPRIVFTI